MTTTPIKRITKYSKLLEKKKAHTLGKGKYYKGPRVIQAYFQCFRPAFTGRFCENGGRY